MVSTDRGLCGSLNVNVFDASNYVKATVDALGGVADVAVGLFEADRLAGELPPDSADIQIDRAELAEAIASDAMDIAIVNQNARNLA